MQETLVVDKLTNLKSHNTLISTIEKLSPREIPVLILINIDEFHIYNEIYGLKTGDLILQEFAKLLLEYSKESQYDLYRVSGDEFVFYEVVKIIDPEPYIHDIEELISYVETHPIVLPELEEPINLAVTIGVSFDAENSYGKADMALQEEKVHTYYQSIVDKDKKTIKYEALIRLHQPQSDGTQKIIAPYQFLDFSKVSRQYIALTKIVIQESFETMLQENVHVSINLTFHDIANSEIRALLRESIIKHHSESKTNFDISSQIIFELLTHTRHKDYDTFVEFKALGVLITIDNFGLDFSEMSKVAVITPHYVKIDSNLIKNIDTDKHAYALVSAIVKFTKELGIKTIAEHVESETVFETAKKLQIDEFQGYFFSEPLESVHKKANNSDK